VKQDKNRPQQKIEKKPEDLPVFVPLGSADELKARIKKMYPGLTDEQIEAFM
jgi:hypothetical protein